MEYSYINILSKIVGWIYFFSWSFSFYPQLYIIYKSKSVAGFSLEYALLNVSGYLFYSMYSLGGYIYSHLGTGFVELNDVAFAVHGLLLSSAHLTTAFIYKRGIQKHFKVWAMLLLVFEWALLFTVFTIELINPNLFPVEFSMFRVAGYSKAFITLVKYMPQVYLNYKRKSTIGLSMINISLDLSGGFFSVLQQFLDMTYNGLNGKGWSFFGSGGDAFNIVKFFLGIISLIFDIIFLTQCYIIYRNPTNDYVEECEEDVDNNKKSQFLSSSSQISSKERIS